MRPGLPGISWFAPAVPEDRMVLTHWSAGVGPPVVRTAATSGEQAARALVIVSWNIALGAGDVSRALADIRLAHPGAPVVLLLQEAFRDGPEVPRNSPGRMLFAAKLGEGARDRLEIEAIAAREGLHLYYVPSMRNGAPATSDEDRGNAILSTLPLDDFTAIELPFERQRRVAVAATVSGRGPEGRPWRLRVVSSHFDNMVGARRGWILGGEFARVRQARAIVDHLRDEPVAVLGGDFNTWFGFHEQTTSEVAAAFPGTDLRDRRPTFAGLLRLDHLFFRLPDGWRGRIRRADDRYGSDHYPLVATIDVRTQTTAESSPGVPAAHPDVSR